MPVKNGKVRFGGSHVWGGYKVKNVWEVRENIRWRGLIREKLSMDVWGRGEGAKVRIETEKRDER